MCKVVNGIAFRYFSKTVECNLFASESSMYIFLYNSYKFISDIPIKYKKIMGISTPKCIEVSLRIWCLKNPFKCWHDCKWREFFSEDYFTLYGARAIPVG